jgi:hypothetical protein
MAGRPVALQQQRLLLDRPGNPADELGRWVTVQTNGVIASGTGSVKSYICVAPA